MQFALEILSQLRHHQIPCDLDLSGKKLQQGLQLANQLGARYVLILGDEELKTGRVQIKTMQTREVSELSLDQLFEHLKTLASWGTS